MNPPTFAHNLELFERFQALQRTFVAALARHPHLICTWLAAQPPRETEAPLAAGSAKSWRTARLSAARRRELAALAANAVDSDEGRAALAAWLLSAVPVCTYLEIAEQAKPSLSSLDAAAHTSGRQLLGLREDLFLANYGLARAAARARCRYDYDDRLSAASCGLLDAIDRYLPGPRAARFGYFATYWIRYRLGRLLQKQGSLVSFPIHQHRISRRIDRYLAAQRLRGLPPPTETQVCAELKLGADAYYWHQRRPRMVSLQRSPDPDNASSALEFTLCDPAPAPSAELDEHDVALQLRRLLRARLTPQARVILARCGGIDSLADAAQDYLTHLCAQAGERLRPRRPGAATAGGVRG